MRLRGLKDEDFLQYKKPCMFLILPYCSFKCDKENGTQVCQNWNLLKQEVIDVPDEVLIERYLDNPITTSLVLGGLEPLDSFSEVNNLINLFRNKYKRDDDIVIFTGYNKEEIVEYIKGLKHYNNIYIKYGRFIPNHTEHFDEVLGVKLGSDNQYAEKIS